MIQKNFGRVAVLMGGHSAEREVSLNSGRMVLTALLESGIDAVGLDTKHQTLAQSGIEHFDRVFIALHGRGGEDGTIQGVLEYLQIPYTGSGVLASALSMDKYLTKKVWQATGLPTPPCRLLNSTDDFEPTLDTLGLPLMIKPVLEGSSVGISKVETAEALAEAWVAGRQYQSPVMAERYISGLEYTAGILHNNVLPVIGLETPKRVFYDYEAKYSDPATIYRCPCGLADEMEAGLQALSLQAFQAVGARGWGRVDIMLDADNQPWLLEVNTVPGMTDHSLVPLAAKIKGINFNDLVLQILADARCDGLSSSSDSN